MRVIKYPLSTEKSFRIMENENKLVFVVDKQAKKQEIKAAIEDFFKVKVIDVNTLLNSKGLKKAYVKFSAQTPAIDIATKLELL